MTTRFDAMLGFLRREWGELIAAAVKPMGQEPMAPEAREGEVIRRASEGQRARAFLEDALFTDFMTKAEAQMTRELIALPLEDDAGRRNLAVAIQTQRQWMKFLTTLASDEQAALAELERLRKPQRPYF